MRPRSRSSSDAEAVAARAPAVCEAASAAATSSGSGLGSWLLGRRRLLLELGRHRGAGGGPSSMAASAANAGAQSSRGAVRKNPLHGTSTACMRDRCGGTLLPCSDDVERLRRELSSSCGRRSAFGMEGMWVVHTRAQPRCCWHASVEREARQTLVGDKSGRSLGREGASGVWSGHHVLNDRGGHRTRVTCMAACPRSALTD